jgi:hypothetical protein
MSLHKYDYSTTRSVLFNKEEQFSVPTEENSVRVTEKRSGRDEEQCSGDGLRTIQSVVGRFNSRLDFPALLFITTI